MLGADGTEQHKLPLPMRGAMPVPTIADVDGDRDLEIAVSLTDAEDGVRQLLVYTFPGSADNCMPWPTGRGNALRTGVPTPVPEPSISLMASAAVGALLCLRRRAFAR